MADLTISRPFAAPQRGVAPVAEFLQSIGANWRRARRAQRLAETWLYMSDSALLARGTTREAVTESIRSVFDETD